jgi:ribosomal protein S18 acetylase RimI-like enzyme
MAYYLNKIHGPSRQATLEKLIHLISTAATLNGADFYEAGAVGEGDVSAQPSFQCAAMFMPPGRAVDDLGLSAWWKLLQQGVLSLVWRTGITAFFRLLFEYPAVGERAKRTVLSTDEQYYYLLMTGTSEEHRGKGLCSAIIREYQAIAQEKGLPIWLEATTKGSMSVYAKAGFENVDGKWVIGEGKCDASGEKANGKDAVGVEVFPMVWWPNGYVRREERK